MLLGQATMVSADGSYHFGFKKSVNGQPPSIDEEGFKSLLKQRGAIFTGDPAIKELYLTFDNGYEQGYTGKILDVLKEKQVPAIFFVTGHYIKTEPELLKRMAQEGHLIGNHSWSHPDMSQISAERIQKELNQVRDEVSALTGQKEMRYLRAPRGIFNSQSLAVSQALGYTNVFWSVAYRDWEPKHQKGWEYAYKNVMAQLHPGAVILLHSVSKDNTEALARIIDDAKSKGYQFKSLDEMQSRTP
ncbi:delta-lactam-biosynthetic de-N-acetylase [Paenibacillus andongensis]|uniref:delta-lactam-biosynthetic de-N-acetylase n=1 Tax=Paenibacillus andongensis TaxID=2975482 RepID=UPI0021BB36C6|nr:delta-lactam-biosynthetic de-N-acetylase [Paenibacillus andongensis]